MTKFLQRLQKEVLDKFPFSISGYNSPDKEYEEFFHRICKFQESLDGDSKIHFTISGFAKLKAVKNLSEAEFDKWETESLKDFLFNDNYLGFPEPILSLYITLLERLSANKRVVNILARNVYNSILIKILLRDELEKIHFSFIKSDNTLLIEVPLSTYFKNMRGGRKVSHQDIFTDIDYETDLIVRRKGHSSSYLIDLAPEKKRKFDAVLDGLLNIKNIETITSHPPENIYDKLLKEVLKNENYTAKEIYSLIFASAVLCFFYDCSLTYFVSTARVANDRRYTLGAMGIGLKAGDDLTDNDKALYSILVNHLAANLSTQLVYEGNKHLKRENDRATLREALNKIKNIASSPILHGQAPAESEFESQFLRIYEENSELLTEYFKQSYESLKAANCSHISKYCLVQLINSGDCEDCNIKERPALFKRNSGEKCCSSIGNMDLINVPLIEALFENLTKSEKGNKARIEAAHINADNEIIFTIIYTDNFDVRGFIEKLKDSRNGSLIGEFFIKKFHALDCHGIFKMIDESSGREFFNSRETIQGVNLNERRIIINEHYQFPDIQSASKIKIVFKNEL